MNETLKVILLVVLLVALGWMFGYLYERWNKKRRFRAYQTDTFRRASRVYPKVIVAGTTAQALIYIRDNDLDPKNVVIATSPEKLQGLRFRGRDVIRTGTWYNRADIEKINEIVIRTSVIMGER